MSDEEPYTWVAYQLWMMGLSLTLFVALMAAEFVIRKLDVLHSIYGQMLKLRNRKLLFYNVVDVTDNDIVVWNASMAMRLNVILVISYLWQFCVIESYSVTNGGFPSTYCGETKPYSCFQAALKWDTYMSASDMIPIDCAAGPAGFTPVADPIVVSCFRILDQTAPNWIQNLAIANALGLLVSRIFEILVWVCFRSLAFIIALSVFGTFLLIAVIVAGVSGTFSTLVSSWLGFIAFLIFPLLIYLIRAIAIETRRIRKEEIQRVQEKTRTEFHSIARQLATPAPSTIRKRNVKS
jgi:ABC-type multidrug transport system fused ATPase/permease subunit